MTQQHFGIEGGDFKDSVLAYNLNLTLDLEKLEKLFRLAWEKLEADFKEKEQLVRTWEWEYVAWEEAAEDYAEKMARLYGTMRVLGMSKPVPLTGIYTDVNLLDKPTAWRHYSRKQLEEEFRDPERHYRQEERHDGFELARQVQKLFVLGKPGSGKTTFVKYMMLQALQGKIQKVPIFVSLNKLADEGQGVLPFLVKQFEICYFPDAKAFVEQLLKRGGALLLFDGLDEVPHEGKKRQTLIKDLYKFFLEYDTNQVIMTCRIAASEYRFERFTYVEMADFTPEQVEVFVGKWFSKDEEKGKRFLEELAKERHKGLREMTRNPLLLVLLCLTFEGTLTFPPRRVEIYREALDVLLKRWDASHNIQRDEIYRKLSVERKEQLFARVAAETFEAGEYFIQESKLASKIKAHLTNMPSMNQDEEIDGPTILKAIEEQHGIFSQRAQGFYSFAHLTFQEYFTTQYIIRNEARGTIQGLIENHLTDDRWREIFLLTASSLYNADHFFELFIKQTNQLIASDKQLIALLAWADKKAVVASSSKTKITIRNKYIYLALIFSRGRGLDRVRGRGLNQALDRVLGFGLDLDLDLELGRALDRALGLDRALDQTLDRSLSRALERVRSLDLILKKTKDLNFKIDFTFILLFISTSIFSNKKIKIKNSIKKDLFNKIKLSVKSCKYISKNLYLSKDLHKELQGLVIPEVNASEEEWQTFHNTLQNIFLKYREFKLDWQLTIEQYEGLTNYLERTKFLVKCLELAYVSNRKAIEQQLLLPPAPAEEPEQLPPVPVEQPVQEPVQEQLPPVPVEVEEPVQEQLPPLLIQEPVEEELSPVKVDRSINWSTIFLAGLLIGGLVGWLISWLVILGFG